MPVGDGEALGHDVERQRGFPKRPEAGRAAPVARPADRRRRCRVPVRGRRAPAAAHAVDVRQARRRAVRDGGQGGQPRRAVPLPRRDARHAQAPRRHRERLQRSRPRLLRRILAQRTRGAEVRFGARHVGGRRARARRRGRARGDAGGQRHGVQGGEPLRAPARRAAAALRPRDRPGGADRRREPDRAGESRRRLPPGGRRGAGRARRAPRHLQAVRPPGGEPPGWALRRGQRALREGRHPREPGLPRAPDPAGCPEPDRRHHVLLCGGGGRAARRRRARRDALEPAQRAARAQSDVADGQPAGGADGGPRGRAHRAAAVGRGADADRCGVDPQGAGRRAGRPAAGLQHRQRTQCHAHARRAGRRRDRHGVDAVRLHPRRAQPGRRDQGPHQPPADPDDQAGDARPGVLRQEVPPRPPAAFTVASTPP